MKTYKPMTNGEVYKKLDDVILRDDFAEIFKSPWKYKGLTTADIDYLIDIVHKAGHDLPTGYKIPMPTKKATTKKKGAVKCIKKKTAKKVLVGSVLRSATPSSKTSTPATKAKAGAKKPTK